MELGGNVFTLFLLISISLSEQEELSSTITPVVIVAPTTTPLPSSVDKSIKKFPNASSNSTDKNLHGDSFAPHPQRHLQRLGPCNRSREIFSGDTWGILSDGPANYSQDTTCEWLISATPGEWINVKVDRIRTECSYDYLFVLDGQSYNVGKGKGQSRLLASFSGASDPHVTLLAQSGHVVILLYSDPNYVLEGFVIEYSISPCPINCSGVGQCIRIQNEHVCRCEESHTGLACQTPKPSEKSKVLVEESFSPSSELIAASWQSPLARVGHSLIRIENRILIYGGFDLNTILDDLTEVFVENGTAHTLGNWSLYLKEGWPKGRFGHAAVEITTGFVVHGGKTDSGHISNELFYYNGTNGTWKGFHSEESEGKLPRLMYHSMTKTPNGWIYVYGGGTLTGEFSSELYKFHESEPWKWKVVKSSCCGKPENRRVLGHSMTYWDEKNALIMFGGVETSDLGRFSRLSSHLWIFFLDTLTWLQLDYRKNGMGGAPIGLSMERGFHTAHLVDRYLTIVGGYTHQHNKDETCYSSQMLVYNLECHTFLPPAQTGSGKAFEVPPKGIFGHQSLIWKGELLVFGGFRGYLSQNIQKIQFPFGNHRWNGSREGSDCLRLDRWRCSGDPKCGWCPTNSKCFDKLSGGANCTTNLQTVQCPGMCPMLSSCQACVAPGGCNWCGSLEQCWSQSATATEESSRGLNCKDSRNEPALQWTANNCTRRNYRRGVTQFEYRFPPNFSHPDSVKIINSSIVILTKDYKGRSSNENMNYNLPVTYILRGSLVGTSFSHPAKKLELCAMQAAVNLTLESSGEETLNLSLRWTDYQLCYNLTWPSGRPVILLPGLRVQFYLSARSFGRDVSQEKSGRVAIQQKYPTGTATRALRKDYLVSFNSSSDILPLEMGVNICLRYESCLLCVADSACVWRSRNGSHHQCVLRSAKESYNNNEVGESLIVEPEECPLCSDIASCEQCVSGGLKDSSVGECEWWDEDASCQRRGRFDGAVRSVAECPTPCSLRNNCSSCLDGAGKCVWCEQKAECFVFSVYTSYYQYGQCFGWIDKVDQCQRCDRQSNCDACILNMGCGWSYDVNGGSCLEGDFAGPYNSTGKMHFENMEYSSEVSGTQVGHFQENNKTWTYGTCPDVDECELGIHTCHSNAACVNTPGSFNCICAQGYTGDGREACYKTCERPCVHGLCSPQFICECDLGWTGTDCSIDCGCHNHSHCETGLCDKCLNFTMGVHCEFCVEGTHGDATLGHVGCSPCQCNRHGDLSRGVCDKGTGYCFCLNNTTGKDCSECEPGYYGNPREGRPCYRSCESRNLIEASEGYFGLKASPLRPGFLPKNGSVQHCMWKIHVQDKREEAINITIDPGFHIPCSENVLLFYAGYSEFGVENNKDVPLIAAICSNNNNNGNSEPPELTQVLVQNSRIVSVLLKYSQIGTNKYAFNASFKLTNISEEMGAKLSISDGPLNISKLYEGPSLSVLSRYGHSLHASGNNLWIFGGYSLSHGPLNDIRHFSRESNSWLPLTITVVQNEEAVPPPRYFHGGVVSLDHPPELDILVHGGISSDFRFLSDTWKFNTRTSRWAKFCEGPAESPKLAGHTLTLRSGSGGNGPVSIVMIGGFNPEEGFSDKVYSIGGVGVGLPGECWTAVETSGSSPLGIYGHSTVYHEATDSFYVFGGILYDIMGHVGQGNHVGISKRLYVLQWTAKRWSVLSPLDENQVGPLPPPRFLHGAVTTPEYMVVLGGIPTTGHSHNMSLFLYVYKCNLWLMIRQQDSKRLSRGQLHHQGENIGRVAGAMSIWGSEIFEMGGWSLGTSSESLFKLLAPKDVCSLQGSKSRCKGTLGCSFCSSNNNRTQVCYNANLEMPSTCSSGASFEFWQGRLCSASWGNQRECSRFTSCTECLASWPFYSNETQQQGCGWCTNGKGGRCISLSGKKKYNDENECGGKQGAQWVPLTDSTYCPERLCLSPQCDKCTASGKCIWTRQIIRPGEIGWELRRDPVFEWNCVRKSIESILDTSRSVSIVSSPPASCPIPCAHFDSCQECLESPGAEGAFHHCTWSVTQGRCFSPAYASLLCFAGMCGPILKGHPSMCPKSCSAARSCAACLQSTSCGWCAIEGENGQGVCLSAEKVPEKALCSNLSHWHYMSCPKEDECSNGHHGCDTKSEECIDLHHGYQCQCKKGFERAQGVCVPICSEGCVHGACKEPETCQCYFGYVGPNCSFPCDCNGHSNCAGIDQLSNCLDCQNNTMGPKCSQCKPMFVGEPKNSGSCIPCVEYCNGHSSICLAYEDFNKWCNGTNRHLPASQLMSRILASGIQAGPSTTAVCCHCRNQTVGDTCQDCSPGYFRGYEEKRLPCRKCECQGHGDTCDPVTGHSCNCHNNTESDHCSQTALKQNPHHQCWKHQCTKCRESYLGTPTNGHQCYRQMHVDTDYCFDPTFEVMKQKPLMSGKTVFFAVQPKFMNVNIRVTLDVTHGAINVYLSPKDDTFVIKQDHYNWVHKVELDSKYGLSGEKSEGVLSKKTLFSTTSTAEGGSIVNGKLEPDYEFVGNVSEDVGGLNRLLPKPIPTNVGYEFIESEAAGYVTYYSVQQPKSVLLVRNLRNRLVITLPQNNHDLRVTRFYLVLEGLGDVSFGSVFFRQDQLHIDLFVFFSVFFSAFFLFLAGCGVAWKVKQNMDARRARDRHVAEMLSMAKRPFAVWTLLMKPEIGNSHIEAYSQCRKSCRKGCICLRPVAVEWTSGANSSTGVCSMFVIMPGGPNAPVRLCVASVLASIQRAHQTNHPRRRRLHQ